MGEGYHKKSVATILHEFSSSRDGLTTDQIDINRKTHGWNKLSEVKQKPLFIQFLLQFKNFFSLLLLAGSALSFLGEYLSPGQGNILIAYALLGVTVLNAAFSFFQDYKAQVVMKSFKNLLPPKILVLRDSTRIEVSAQELVPGDIIILREGDKVPADARIIQQSLLKVDHSMLTGETEPQLRSTEMTSEKELLSRNMLFSGTLVQSGSGMAIVVRVGDATEIGKIAKLTGTVEKKESNIKKEIDHFVKVISRIAIVLGVLFFAFGLVVGKDFWANLVFAIGIIVANVPEGLLPTVTLTLSLAGKRMAKHNAWVKDIESIETLGSVTTICTDKTGTLTENKLSVVSLFYDNKLYELNQKHKTFFNSETKDYLHHTKDKYYDRMLSCMYLCNNAIRTGKNYSGDPTEIALLQGVDLQKNTELYADVQREEEIPFDSEKKYMITACKTAHHRIAYMKGAPEAVTVQCTHIIENNKKVPLTEEKRQHFIEENIRLAKQGYRVLALSYMKLHDKVATPEFIEKDEYVLLGFVALQDPPRPEVAHAVQQCYDAGIRIIIMSGDQVATVSAIAQQVGIAKDSSVLALTNDDLEDMTDNELKELLAKNRDPIIFARSYPTDKLRVVRLLQELGEVVSVTGDGVNDAPALQQAHVGVAMGKGGTDVAKEAANMVLLDDNFATIVKAIKTGRTVYENIKKFIIYILTSNIPEILPFLFFVMFGWPLALPVLLILAIDLGTDMIPAISLGKEASEGDVMKQPPRRQSKLLTKAMLVRSYMVIGMLQAGFAFIFFFHTLLSQGWAWGEVPPTPVYAAAVGAFFASIIITQIFNQLSCRTLRLSALKRPLGGNSLVLFGILTEMLLLAVIIFYPPVANFFGTAPFDLWYLPFMILGGITIFTIEELRKSYWRRTKKLGVF